MDLVPWRNKRRRGDRDTGEHPLARLRDEMESVFERFFGNPWGTGRSPLLSPTAAFPQLDLTESDSDLTIRAELPGLRLEDVKLEVSGNCLRITGEKSAEREDQGRDYHYSERQFGAFSRTVQLPAAADPNKVDATYKDGVLTVKIAKHPDAKPKRIKVRNA
jgi:HSP20 family protein